jgi:hypothetical protein
MYFFFFNLYTHTAVSIWRDSYKMKESINRSVKLRNNSESSERHFDTKRCLTGCKWFLIQALDCDVLILEFEGFFHDVF